MRSGPAAQALDHGSRLWPAWRPSLPRTIAAATALAIAIVIALFSYIAWRDRQQTLHETEVVGRNLAAVLAEHANRLFETTNFVMREAIRLAGPGGSIPNDRATHESLERLASSAPYVVAIWIGDKDGNAVVTSRAYPTPQVSAADRAYFTAARDRPDHFFIGLLPDNRYTNAVLISTSRRLEPTFGEFRGFVQVSVSADYIRSLYSSLAVDRDVSFCLLDENLRPLLRKPTLPVEQLLAIRTEELLAPVRHVDRGSFVGERPTELGGGQRLYASQRVPSYGAYVVVGLGRGAALQLWHNRLWAYLVAAGATAGASLGLGLLADRQARRDEAFARSLDARVQERTLELQRANASLEEAVARRDVLLREVNHRVKNSLQLVSSLLALQAKQARAPELSDGLAEAQRRVATVARIHERLYRTDRVETVAFGAYLRDLCAELESSLTEMVGERRLIVDAADVELPTDMVAPLALIANELITNAWKHAYPPGSLGSVVVDFESPGALVRLSVSDRGVGLPDGFSPTASTGLGMRLVQALVRQLGGTFHVEPAPPGGHGTSFVIEAPLKEASPDSVAAA
jgi:two-component sensor histidine kinase